MLIGLLSDTHIPDHVKELPKQLEQVFRGVDLILHAGDIYVVSVLDELERLAPVLAARGDDDPPVTASDRRVEEKHIFNIDGVTIMLTHDIDWLPPYFYAKGGPDVIVFGHTHQASLSWKSLEDHGGVLRVNPGSATFPLYKLELGTVGLLTISSGKAEAQIIQLE